MQVTHLVNMVRYLNLNALQHVPVIQVNFRAVEGIGQTVSILYNNKMKL